MNRPQERGGKESVPSADFGAKLRSTAWKNKLHEQHIKCKAEKLRSQI